MIVSGGSIDNILSFGLGGSRGALSFNQSDPIERMKWVRSHKKSGGSMLPLGY
jgi:hypothetical protein